MTTNKITKSPRKSTVFSWHEHHENGSKNYIRLEDLKYKLIRNKSYDIIIENLFIKNEKLRKDDKHDYVILYIYFNDPFTRIEDNGRKLNNQTSDYYTTKRLFV